MKSNIIHLDQENLSSYSIAIGFFDGLHLGHQALFKEVLKGTGIPSILTFTRNEKERTKNSPLLILGEKERNQLLQLFQIEQEFILPFTEELMHLSYQDFISFLKRLHPKDIVVGDDFCFGYQAKGRASDLLVLEQEGIHIHIVNIIESLGKKISTSQIKEEIQNGNIKLVNQELGYPYFLQGKVIHGLQNGKKLGFPTANIQLDPKRVKLKDGVYKTRTIIEGKEYPSMSNIGNHPTISELDESILETHIIGFDQDIYGKEIQVYFDDFIREQTKFSTKEALIEQLNQDLEKCKKKEAD